MDTRAESILPPFGTSIRIQQKRDRLLSLVGVAEEHARIAKEKFNVYTTVHEKKKQDYLDWCKNNKVDSFIQ